MARRRLFCGMLLGLCAVAQTGGVAGRIEFACLWWSEAQMNGLNPNAPPPKTTEVRIKQWEYSDPVGVPHPDTVDAVLLLTGGEKLAGLEVEISTQWKIGRYGKPGSAVWGPVKQVRKAAAAREMRLPVDLKAMMDTLEKHERWPYGLRVVATLRRGSADEIVALIKAELPIRMGD